MQNKYFIKEPKSGQTAEQLYSQLHHFYSAHSADDGRSLNKSEYHVVASEVCGFTGDGKAVKIPFYDGCLLSAVKNPDLILAAVKSISDWYSWMLLRCIDKKSNSVIHGDLHLSNIILQQASKRIILIDALSKPATEGYVMVDFLTLSASLNLHPVLQHNQVYELCSYLYDRVRTVDRKIFRPALVLKSWALLQMRFLSSDAKLGDKWEASKALFKSLQIWLRILQ